MHSSHLDQFGRADCDKYKPNPPLLVRLTDREQLSRVYIKFSEYDGPRIY